MSSRGGGPRAAACEVWWATPSAAAAHLGLLDDAERRRADRLRTPAGRDRFVTARAVLRLVLAARTGRTPSTLRIEVTCPRCGADHGRPRLVGRDAALSFNLAHTGRRIAVAVADGTTIGVDVEDVTGPAADQLTELRASFLAPEEMAELRRFRPEGRRRALAVWWTRKEALLKATGSGLTVPMTSVGVTAPDEPAGLRTQRGGRPVAGSMALLRDLAPDGSTVACVAALRASSLSVTEHDGDRLLAGALRSRTSTPALR